jgi:hypothetical protein
MKDSDQEKSVCESCLREFSCTAANGHCWCFALELDAETLARLETEFGKCLCRECLTEFSARIADRDFTSGKN